GRGRGRDARRPDPGGKGRADVDGDDVDARRSDPRCLRGRHGRVAEPAPSAVRHALAARAHCVKPRRAVRWGPAGVASPRSGPGGPALDGPSPTEGDMHDAKVQHQKILEAHAEVEEALDRFRADQREGLEVLGRADAGALVGIRFQREADRLRRENEELRAEIRRLKTERAKNLAARAVDAQYRPNVTGRTNEVKPDEWPVFATPAYPDRDDDAILARFGVHPVDTDRWLRMDTVRGRFR